MELPKGVKVTVGGRTFRGKVDGEIPPGLRKKVQAAVDKANGKSEPKKQEPKSTKKEQVDNP